MKVLKDETGKVSIRKFRKLYEEKYGKQKRKKPKVSKKF